MRSPAALQPEEAGGVSVSVVIPSFARMHNLPRLLAALLQLPALRRPSSEVIIAHGSRVSLAAVPDFEGQALALARGNVTAEVMRDRLAHFDLVALNDEMYVAERFVAGARARNDVRRPRATRGRACPPRRAPAPPTSIRLQIPPPSRLQVVIHLDDDLLPSAALIDALATAAARAPPLEPPADPGGAPTSLLSAAPSGAPLSSTTPALGAPAIFGPSLRQCGPSGYHDPANSLTHPRPEAEHSPTVVLTNLAATSRELNRRYTSDSHPTGALTSHLRGLA